MEHHIAFVYDRGGQHRIGQLGQITKLQWQRVADDVSLCDIDIVNPGPDCVDLLGQIEPMRHEIVVFRDGQRVWEGPVTLLTFQAETVAVQARDVMQYAYRLALSQDYSNASPNQTTVVKRAELELVTELGRRESEDPPINVVPYIVSIQRPDDAGTTRVTTKYQKTVYDDVDDMAANSGLDYTVIGRSIVLYDTHTALGQTQTLTEADFVGDVVVTMYGMELATFAVVTGDEMYGTYGGTDPYYGRVEIVDDAYDEEEGSDSPSQAELNSQAQRNLAGANPVPIEVRVSDGSQLSPNAPVTLDELIPGVLVPLRATLTARTFSQMQKLRQLTVVEDNESGEAWEVTLVSAPARTSFAGELRTGGVLTGRRLEGRRRDQPR